MPLHRVPDSARESAGEALRRAFAQPEGQNIPPDMLELLVKLTRDRSAEKKTG